MYDSNKACKTHLCPPLGMLLRYIRHLCTTREPDAPKSQTDALGEDFTSTSPEKYSGQTPFELRRRVLHLHMVRLLMTCRSLSPQIYSRKGGGSGFNLFLSRPSPYGVDSRGARKVAPYRLQTKFSLCLRVYPPLLHEQVHSFSPTRKAKSSQQKAVLKKKKETLNLRYAVCTTRTGCYNLQTLAPDFRVHVQTNRVYQLHLRRHPRRCLASPSSTVTHQFCSRTPAVGHAA